MTSVQALRSACDFWRPVHLNEDDSLSLEQITNSFSAPITEEHAFAIIYECCKTLKNVFQGQRSKCAVSVVSSLRDIFLHRDGRVHETTFRAPKSRPRRDSVDRNLDYSRAITDSEEKVITELGLVIYSALDFGLKENEERTLTPGLENLLDLMTSFATESDEDEEDDDDDEDVHVESDKSDPLLHESQAPDLLHPRLHRHDTDDEGIEKDHDDSDHFDGHFSSASSSGSSNDRSCYFSGPSSTSASSSATTSPPPLSTTRQSTTPSPSCRGHAIDQVLCRCANHLSVRSEADAHFRAVCRALVSEALELSSFLEKGRFSVTHSEELQDLALQDWANLWIQTLSELRQGVKLKKTDYTKTPIEFELTPYEILMDDIRSRRYKLNKVMVDGEIPHRIKKDAHDIILEFIRSRPPLKPASQRKLQPCQTYVTPQERLMQEIRSKDPKEFLRKTPGPRQAPKPIQMERSYVGTSIKVHVNGPITNTYPASRSSLNHAKSMSSLSWANCNVNGSRNISSHHSTINIRRSDEHNENDKDELQLRSSQCPSPVKKVVRPDPNFMKFDPDDDDEDMGGPFSNPTDQRTRPQRRVQWQSDALDLAVPSSSSRNPSPRRVSLHSTQYHPPSRDSPDHSPVVLRRSNRKTSQSFLHNDQWASALQTLDLTLAEVVHIRSVLTKAELESLTIDTNLREDLEKKKVCFLCMKTRFGLFTWSYECQLCHHTVCSGCLSKMRIPSEHFSNIPVFALSPLPSKEEERENRLFSFSAKRRASSFFPESDLPSATSENDTNSRRKSMSDRVADNNGDIMQSLPANRSESSPRKDSKVKLRRSNTVCHKQKPDLSSSSQVNVCIDCKEMILQIIRTQRATRRQQFTKSLCLS